MFRRRDFNGDILLLLSQDQKSEHTPNLRVWSDSNAPDENDRINLPYQIECYGANRLSLSLVVPGEQPVWLYYSDVWHPWWRAVVNGLNQNVFRAQLAYKAMLFNPGQNTVDFIFGKRLVGIILKFLVFNAWLWMGFCVWTLGSIFTKENDENPFQSEKI